MSRLILIAVALALLAGCMQPQTKSPPAAKSAPAKPAKTKSAPAAAAKTNTPAEPPAAEKPPKIAFNEAHDKEIAEVLELAKKDQWEEAQVKVTALVQSDPKNIMLQRLQTWVAQAGQKRREQKLEDEIRKIDAKNSVFNPTIPGLLKEQKDRGLPARKDVRDVIDQIESQPYIPPNYGKTIFKPEPMFDIDAAKGPMARVLEKEVSVHFDSVPLDTVIVNLSQSSSVNIVADKALAALTNRLTMSVEKVKLGEFFKFIGRNYNLQFQVGPELVWVVDAGNTNRLMEETRYYKLRNGFVLPAQMDSEEAVRVSSGPPGQPPTTTTETQKFKRFVNDAAPAMPAIERAITNLFVGKYFIDYEHNQIMARATPEQLDVLERIIKEFDQPIQQVLIEARFVTLSKPAFMQLGVLWETGRQVATGRTPQDFTGQVTSQNIQNMGLGIQYTFTNVLDEPTLTATISALEQQGESQTLSTPRLTVINNRPATINDGKVQYYYEEYQVKQTVQQYYTASSFVPAGKPAKITSGAELNVLASISGDGQHILLALNPRVNTDVQMVPFATLTDYIGGTNFSTFNISLPQYRTQELNTRAVVKSGETVVMGGVLERQRSTLVESVPVLGNIPVLGVFFRRRNEVDTPRYLLVFVTATILTESGEFLKYQEPALGDKGK